MGRGEPHPQPLSNSLTPQPLSKGEGSDMLQDTPASTNNAPAKTPAEHSTPLSLGEGNGGEAPGNGGEADIKFYNYV